MTTRIKELPSAAGDIERQLNGASFAVRCRGLNWGERCTSVAVATTTTTTTTTTTSSYALIGGRDE